MATVAIVNGMLVVLYVNDHDPPHVHIVDAAFTARIEIDGPSVMSITGRMTSTKRRRIIAWIAAHRGALRERRIALRAGQPVDRIED
jgi:hypothetical protein